LRVARSSRSSKARIGIEADLPAMPPAERRLARIVSVATTPCELWFIERMVERSGATVTDDLERLLALGVLRDTAGGLCPASEAVRDAVLRATPPSFLSALRQRAAEVLAAAGLGTLAAIQLLRAVDAGFRVDLDLVSEVAGSPSVDPSTAADLLIAIRMESDAAVEPGRRRRWMLSTVDHLMLAGRWQQALELLTQEVAADRDAALHRAELLGRLGALHGTENPSRALEFLRRALAEKRLGQSERVWLLATAAFVASRVGHPEAATFLRRAGRAQATGHTPGGDIQLALAKSAMALSRGDLPLARRALSGADPAAPSARPQAATLRAERIVLHLAMGEFEDARAALHSLAADAGVLGAAVEPRLAALGCLLRVAVGELPEAEAQARLALRSHQDRRLPEEARAELLGVVAEVLFRRGQSDRARELLDPEDGRHDWPDNVPWLPLRCAAAADPDPLWRPDLVRAAIVGLSRSLRPLVLVPHLAARLVRAALLLGDLRSARLVAGYTATVAARTGIALWAGAEQHACGLIERDPARLREAVARLRTTGARPALADALHDLARLPQTPTAEARAAVEECAALFGRIGAIGDQERAQQWCTEIGATGRRRRSTAVGQGFAALTRREVRVAELLAAGATKQQAAARLYVSFHTVDAHLRSVYAKLGIRSRVQLARIWDARHDHTRAA
jgi:DNA-binding CsgD family transcriptional regulator/tetratricopeptide (TPR) repeat protein